MGGHWGGGDIGGGAVTRRGAIGVAPLAPPWWGPVRRCPRCPYKDRAELRGGGAARGGSDGRRRWTPVVEMKDWGGGLNEAPLISVN